MNEKGIQPTQEIEQEINQLPMLLRWLTDLQQVFPRTRTYSVTVDPASVSGTSESVQTFTVTGLTTNDIVTVNKPSNTAGLDIVQAWVSAADTLSLKFRNTTGSPIDAASETYLVMATRR